MTRARARKMDAGTAAEAVGGDLSVRRPTALDDCIDPAARAILECGMLLAYGRPAELLVGRFAVALTWRGGALRVFDGTGRLRGVFASWHGASVEALVAIVEASTPNRDAVRFGGP